MEVNMREYLMVKHLWLKGIKKGILSRCFWWKLLYFNVFSSKIIIIIKVPGLSLIAMAAVDFTVWHVDPSIRERKYTYSSAKSVNIKKI